MRSVWYDPEDAEARLRSQHQRAAAARLQDRPWQWARLARRCRSWGLERRSLAYYGKAIDDLLYLGQYRQAANLCRELLAAFPSVVRARCTLAFLSLRDGYSAEFIRAVEDYVRAAQVAGQAKLALSRLRMMADVTSDGAVRRFLDRRIHSLGEKLNAVELLERTFSRDGRPLLPVPGDQEERWAFMLRLAITGPTASVEESEPAGEGAHTH